MHGKSLIIGATGHLGSIIDKNSPSLSQFLRNNFTTFEISNSNSRYRDACNPYSCYVVWHFRGIDGYARSCKLDKWSHSKHSYVRNSSTVTVSTNWLDEFTTQ